MESKPNKSFTELELRIAAKNISLQFGVVEVLIAEARKVRNIKNGIKPNPPKPPKGRTVIGPIKD